MTVGAWLHRCALVLVLLVPLRCLGADERDLTAQLSGINASVKLAETEIDKIKGEFNALLVKRKQIETSLAAIKADDKALQRKIFDLRAEEDALKGEVAIAEKNAAAHQSKIQARLRAMYVNASVSANPIFSGITGRGDLERLSLYARRVRDMDAKVFKEASDAVAALMYKRGALNDTIAAEQVARDELAKKRKDAEAEAAKLKAVGVELTEKQEMAQRSLALLRDEAKKVEEMITSITSGDESEASLESGDAEEKSSVVSGSEPKADDVPTPQSTSVQPAGVFPSIFDAGVKLFAPIKGSVLQGFGRSKVTSFADMVFSKGVDFSATSGSDVHAVLGGKVAFAGVMPGFEQVLVLEHGGRSYSLYGRLGGIGVKIGDPVQQDQVIATTSTPDPKGRNFYFEVRKNGNPVNPETVIRPISR